VDTRKTVVMPWYIEHDFCATERNLGDVSHYVGTNGKAVILHRMSIHYLTKQGHEVRLDQRSSMPNEDPSEWYRGGLESLETPPLNLKHWTGEFDSSNFGKVRYVTLTSKGSGKYGASASFKYKGRIVNIHCDGFTGFLPRRTAEKCLRDVVNALVVLKR
jgi:hypothetical protein